MNYEYGFHLSQPWWLAGCILLVPVIWLAWRNLAGLNTIRRVIVTVLRCVVIILLLLMLSMPALTRKSRNLTLIIVKDISLSIPAELQQRGLDYLSQAVKNKPVEDRLAVVDVAESVSISSLPSGGTDIHQRNTTLTGRQSRLSDGIQMAMAIAPPDTASRILLASEGNETAGDLKKAAQAAAANKIPIDILPLRYKYDNEVIFRRLSVPATARSNQTVSLRFILNSTAKTTGQLQLNLNNRPVDLDPDSVAVTMPIELNPGTNVKVVSVPLGSRGIHEFEAIFLPDDPQADKITANNRATAITNVSGPGNVFIIDNDGSTNQPVTKVLKESGINIQYCPAAEFPDNLIRLMDTDAVILVNTDSAGFTYQQQEILSRYVTDLGGGLVMIGGPQSFGAGGWIGSPVAEILPVDLDPPQKEQMPKGALVLVIDRSGSMTGEKVEMCKLAASAAVRLLSQRDIVGIVIFDARSLWLVPPTPANNKEAIYNQIHDIGSGGGTIMGPAMEMAFDGLKNTDAGIKHIILLTDGQTSDRDFCANISNSMAAEKISVSTVAVGPDRNDQLLNEIAQTTGGRYYSVDDPMKIPEIFTKEAQVVKRPMIIEKTFTPRITSGINEIIRGFSSELPSLDGYIFTGTKGGLNQVVFTSDQSDPIFAACQSGLGRCVAFTSSIDSRWASQWLSWGGFARFWEQTVRWAAKPAQSVDLEVFTDVQGNQVTINAEAVDQQGKFIQFANIDAQVISPDVSSRIFELTQIGPGEYSGRFDAIEPGSYVVNIRYKKLGEDAKTGMTASAVTIPFAPEFRDFSDNMPLLTEVSSISGGRIMSWDPNGQNGVSDPNKTELFSHAGLKFPESQVLLVRPLIFAWLVLFLLDVATRRIMLDFKAMTRRLAALLSAKKSRRKEDTTLSRLKLRRQKVREQLSVRSAETSASVKYQADVKFESKLPLTETMPVTEGNEDKQGKKKDDVKKSRASTQQQAGHIERLLKAKRDADHKIQRPEGPTASPDDEFKK
jgi:Ca-activated chloride channel homolog